MSKSKYLPYKDLIISGELSSRDIAQMIGDGCTACSVRSARRRFLKPKIHYTSVKTWRKKNPQRARKIYNDYIAQSHEFAVNNRAPWSTPDEEFALSTEYTGMEIAHALGRSLSAVYRKRNLLRKQA